MPYYDEQLQILQQQVERKKRLEAELTDLTNQIEELYRREQELKKIKLSEQSDVDRLEGRSLAVFFYNTVGKMDDKLDKERQEAYAAAVKYDAVAKELADAQEDMLKREKENWELKGCEQRYADTLRAKADAIKASGSPEAIEILKVEETISYINNQKREIREAISAGQRALSTANTILSSLGSAKGWGTWDLLGGGLISDLAKHSHLDEAQRQVERLQSELRRFKTELADVTIQANLQVSIEGFLRFADYFFDGLFADWAVLDKISQSQSQIQSTKNQIESVLKKLNTMLSTADQELAIQKANLDRLIIKTQQ